MASKGPRSKLDHETRARRQKALEAPKEPRRPTTHWDHVLEEMVWLSKDFESERKWKLAQAKKVAIRASKGMLDQATKGERRVKEEEQRLRKVALNISKDMKKFWIKIEKLVLYKHQLELDEKKKKALDKQLEFLLGQTERYSTMLAENLVSTQIPCKRVNSSSSQQDLRVHCERVEEDDVNNNAEPNTASQPNAPDIDTDYDIRSEDESEDDEHTIEEDEALITKEEREEELEALQNEIDLPLDELLKRYGMGEDNREDSLEKNDKVPEGTEKSNRRECNGKEDDIAHAIDRSSLSPGRCCVESNGFLSTLDNHINEDGVNKARSRPKKSQEPNNGHMMDYFDDEQDDDDDFVIGTGVEKECNTDDETTLSEEEAMAKAESDDALNEIELLQKESEIPIDELVARNKKGYDTDEDVDNSDFLDASASDDLLDSSECKNTELKQAAGLVNEDDEPTVSQQADSFHREDEAEYGGNSGEERESERKIADAAAAARSAQPTGNTFLTTKVRTKLPFLLKYSLREYQHIGLDWLVTMYEKKLNGILADEMGLGKTIMTIALLGHLACEKGIWGPHLIVVPTSVMLNWETEFLKWCPAFKILTYFGSAKERKIKRQGWLKQNSFHVCITTYRLVIQDSKVFKRKKWKYLILDEAHLIKNWKSQRWQTLLNFNSKRRILLTGTPLQNDLMELWSLMHFLMPHIFQSHQEFKDWFCNPIAGMVDGQEKVNKEVVDRLHNVLRPFILRRLKRDVEKQLPMKHEHIVYCRLSRRQRNLYEDFIASSETQATLASSNFFGMISVIMQLRKVCNHPDLFEGRPIVSSFDMNGIDTQFSSTVCSMLSPRPFSNVDLTGLGFLFTHLEFSMTSWESDEVRAIMTPSSLIESRASLGNIEEVGPGFKQNKKLHGTNIFEEIQKALREERLREAKDRAASIAWWNSLRCGKKPIYSTGLQELVTIKNPVHDIHRLKSNSVSYLFSSKLADIVLSPVERFQKMVDQVESFMFAIPAARAPPPVGWCSKTETSVFLKPMYKERCFKVLSPLLTPFRPALVRRQVYFPDRRLIQFDCGKLQELAVLLRRLKSEGHRALIFTQMTKMLDVLEAFINLYGYTYMRLDGSTQPEDRQMLMQRFNTNPKYFLFILSTRSGGVGINLVGADTVIFYDSDWNPAMDQQAQDRCHRIGQTREVHIYRLISESTIEENIIKKANQKRALDDLVIQGGSYNTEFFKKLDPMELFSGHRTIQIKGMQNEKHISSSPEVPLTNAEVEAALKNAEDEADYMALKKVEQEEAVDKQEFTEEAIGKLDEDELPNEEDMRTDEPADHGCLNTSIIKDKATTLDVSNPAEDGALSFAEKADDIDMLADVKQMAAAAAAAGQAISSFESQLRPIDRYAMRFLELWDPIINKAAIESQIQFEEREWELDRIEKLKEDLEAEIDDDEEPLVYERWDADFATEAYRQQVEALAQHQLMEELEREAREKELAEYNESMRKNLSAASKTKSKKKAKKAKFKSLKKGHLASGSKAAKEESPLEPVSLDDDITSYEEIDDSDIAYSQSTLEKKRKSVSDYDEAHSTRKPKKSKKAPEITPVADSKAVRKQHGDLRGSKLSENSMVDIELRPINRNKIGGKISITAMPVKRVLTIKPEKLKRKVNFWSKDPFQVPDDWLGQEDAILCASVHEYGPNWSLVSEILHGMTGGGFYRGKFRHPVHCCERFRELIHRHVLSTSETLNNDKAGNTGSGKSLLKVTEDNVQMLLDAVSERPNDEPLVQKHFFALLSSVWKVSTHHTTKRSLSSLQNGFYLPRSFSPSKVNGISWSSMAEPSEKMRFSNLTHCGKLVEAALSDDHSCAQMDNKIHISSPKLESFMAPEQLDIVLEIQGGNVDSTTPLPSVINLSVLGTESPLSSKISAGEGKYFRSSVDNAENRFRVSSRACVEDSLGWASLAFPIVGAKSRTPSKSLSIGKHKLPFADPIRPSKSKLRKTSESSDTRCLPTDTVGQPVLAVSYKSQTMIDTVSPAIPQGEIDDTFSCFPGDLNSSHALESDTIDMFPHHFVRGLLSGLDDFSQFPPFSDIG